MPRWPIAAPLLALAGCHLLAPYRMPVCPSDDGGVDADGGADPDADIGGDGDTDEDADTNEDADIDEDADVGPAHGGSATWVGQGIDVVSEALFDLDGDGEPDNVFADLGPDGGLMAMALSALLWTTADPGFRQVVHLPWIDDVTTFSDTSATLIVFVGFDTDEPLDPSDDYDGEEPFYVGYGSLDPCGEPRQYYPDTTLDRGALDVTGSALSLSVGTDIPVVIRDPVVEGEVGGGGATLDLLLAGALLARELGAVESTEPEMRGYSFLEILVGGGRSLGFPTAPGLSPDLDLDGDGLERFELDEDGRLLRCIDGDRTVVDGPECYSDDRFADGFAMTIELDMVAAVFAGRRPGWEDHVDGECDEPPAESRWDPPAP